MRIHFTIKGKDTTDRLVVGNVFPFVDRLGIPLSLVYDKLREVNVYIDWHEFVTSAIKAKWNLHTIKSRIMETLMTKEEKEAFVRYWEKISE